VAAALGLEVASGNDAMSSHSQMRKTAKLMLQMLPGTDFITSGHSVMPRKDNLFGGGNFDAEDMDDWLVIQRDMQIDGGLRPVHEVDVLQVREKSARAIQAVFKEMDFPPISDAEVDAATTAFCSDDLPDRDSVADLAAADQFLESDKTALDVIAALARSGFEDVAESVLEMQRQRVLGDYLHTSAIFDKDFNVKSALNTPNDYQGPGSGYRVTGETWKDIQNIPQALDPRKLVEDEAHDKKLSLRSVGASAIGNKPEVVVAVGPAFTTVMNKTLADLSHADVLRAILNGIEAKGLPARVVKVWYSADLANIGLSAAKLSGSGIAIGLQSKGTALIHKKGLAPLNNLELLSMAPNLTLDSYRTLGSNAACYATNKAPYPVPMKIDNMARLRLIVHTTLLHHREVRQIDVAKPIEDVEAIFS